MPFPLPTPSDLKRQQEGFMEDAVRAYADANGLSVSAEAISRAVRSPHGLLNAIAGAQAQLLYGAHLHLRWYGDMYMPDTADGDYLVRHSAIWGIFRRPATQAVGKATFAGAAGTAVPLGLELRSVFGAMYLTTQAGAIPAGGTIVLAIAAVEAGADGNAGAAEVLTLVTPLIGLTEQTATVDAGGLSGGAPIESDPDLLERLLERIREPAHGGAAFDYPVWVRNVFAASQVRCLPNWVGYGTVGVCIAGGTQAAPTVPNPTELAAIEAYLGTINSQTGVRPVTAQVVMVPAVLVPVACSILLDPFDLATQAAVEVAVKGFFVREARIGEKLYRSRLSEAISAARGEYRHELQVPAVDVAPAATGLPVPGAITWVAPA